MYSAAYQTASGSVIYAGVTTYSFTLVERRWSTTMMIRVTSEPTSSWVSTISMTAGCGLMGGSDGRDRVYDMAPSSQAVL